MGNEGRGPWFLEIFQDHVSKTYHIRKVGGGGGGSHLTEKKSSTYGLSVGSRHPLASMYAIAAAFCFLFISQKWP